MQSTPPEGDVYKRQSAPIQQIQLYNSSGQMLQHQSPLQMEDVISLRDYVPGIYFLKWSTATLSGIHEVIKE